jgi:hypothetical protein
MKASLRDLKSILQQIDAIPTMEIGTLSPYVPTGRPASTQPYFKLQSWQKGKNVTRHVRSGHLSELQAALDGYARFRQLCEHYAEIMVERTRAEWERALEKEQLRPYTRRSAKKSK